MKGKIFLSYRRDGGFEMAKLICESLQERGYKVFLDVEELRSGPFNTALFAEIESSTAVVVILSPNSLDRCFDEGDWLRLEVAHAIRKKKNIVSVMTRGFKWPARPLPDDIVGLPNYNGLEPSHEYFDASMDNLCKLLIDQTGKHTFKRGDFATGEMPAVFDLATMALPPLLYKPNTDMAKAKPSVQIMPTSNKLDESSSTDRGAFEQIEGCSHDSVDCTVFASPEACVGDRILVQVYAHIPDRIQEAQSLALEFDSDARRRGFTSLGTAVRRGTKLTFEMTMSNVVISESVQELVWRGETDFVQFGVSIPQNHTPGALVGKILISQESIPIGRLLFKLRVVSVLSGEVVGNPQPRPCGTATRYSLAFISYASKDRHEVLRRVQMLPAVGIRYFQDVLDLVPGDRWSQELFRHIDESDVMFLFWSSAARDSEWVCKEWRYALERKGDDFIRPVIIEGPPPPEPPEELQHLHFADRALYFIRDSDT